MKTFINYLNENKTESILKTTGFGKYWVIPNTENDKLSYLDLGVLHNENGPAIEKLNGDKHWFINGQLHKEDGPAVIQKNGSKQWWINDKRHRQDGPAVEFSDGYIEWYLNNNRIKPDTEMMCKYIRLNPNNIFKHWDWPKEVQALAIELGGEKIRVKLMTNDKIDPSLISDKFNDLNKRGFFK